MLIRYGGLIANYHHGFTSNSSLVIWLSGMPSLPNDVAYSSVVHRLAIGYDFVCPEYYGFGRSDGEFTPANCLQTLIDTYNFFTQSSTVSDIWTKEEYQFQGYSEIVVIGNSFGASWAIRGVRELSSVSVFGLLSGAIVYRDMGKLGFPEESFTDTISVLEYGGYGNMYRSALGGDRDLFYQDQWGQSYHEMTEALSQKNVFIVHGDGDDCVHVGRSRKLYKELQSLNPGGNHRYLEIPKGGHGGITKQIGVVEMCKWLNKKKH